MGYYACERCVTKGDHIAGAVRFPELWDALRTDEDWESYHRPEKGEVVCDLLTPVFSWWFCTYSAELYIHGRAIFSYAQ